MKSIYIGTRPVLYGGDPVAVQTLFCNGDLLFMACSCDWSIDSFPPPIWPSCGQHTNPTGRGCTSDTVGKQSLSILLPRAEFYILADDYKQAIIDKVEKKYAE